MLFLANSYEGATFLLQLPFSWLCALVAMALAFTKRTRFASVGFALCGILIVLAVVTFEFCGYGVHLFTWFREAGIGYPCVIFLPVILSIVVLLFGRSRGGRTDDPKASYEGSSGKN